MVRVFIIEMIAGKQPEWLLFLDLLKFSCLVLIIFHCVFDLE